MPHMPSGLHIPSQVRWMWLCRHGDDGDDDSCRIMCSRVGRLGCVLHVHAVTPIAQASTATWMDGSARVVCMNPSMQASLTPLRV